MYYRLQPYLPDKTNLPYQLRAALTTRHSLTIPYFLTTLTLLYGCSTNILFNLSLITPLYMQQVVDLEGASRLPPPPPLGVTDWRHHSRSCQLTLNIDCSTAKHGNQNIQKDCHQWLSDSFRVHQIRYRDPTGGAYSAPPDPLSGLRALFLRGRGRERGRRKKKGRGREREGPPLLSQIPGSAPDQLLKIRGDFLTYAKVRTTYDEVRIKLRK